MNSAFAAFFYKLLSLLLSVSLLFSPLIAADKNDPIQANDPENVLLTAALWSDTHLSDYLLSRTRNVKSCVTDLKNGGGIDALIIDGDLTENGKLSELKMLSEELGDLPNVSHVLPATGNHDVRLRYYPLTVRTFSEFCAVVNPSIELQNDALYYSYEVNGYTFIILGTVGTQFEEARIDDVELAFLDEALASAQGKPSFVLLHQPLKNTHALPDAWGSPIPSAGSVGADSDRLLCVLQKYKNVFLISGHLHSGLGENNFEDVSGVHSVNLPSIGIVSKDGGYEAAGTGYMMEVYADRVLFRARSFLTGKYLPEFDRTVPLD